MGKELSKLKAELGGGASDDPITYTYRDLAPLIFTAIKKKLKDTQVELKVFQENMLARIEGGDSITYMRLKKQYDDGLENLKELEGALESLLGLHLDQKLPDIEYFNPVRIRQYHKHPFAIRFIGKYPFLPMDTHLFFNPTFKCGWRTILEPMTWHYPFPESAWEIDYVTPIQDQPKLWGDILTYILVFAAKKSLRVFTKEEMVAHILNWGNIPFYLNLEKVPQKKLHLHEITYDNVSRLKFVFKRGRRALLRLDNGYYIVSSCGNHIWRQHEHLMTRVVGKSNVL